MITHCLYKLTAIITYKNLESVSWFYD